MQDAAADEVAAANRAYYAALSARDLEAMAKVWEQSGEAINIAPPIRPAAHVGWEAIRKNYEQFWVTLVHLRVAMNAPLIVARGEIAWVYGIERTHRVARDGTESAGENHGASVFVKNQGRWLMVFHQAAPNPAA